MSPVEKIAESRLASYKATPSDIRAHFKDELANRKGYCKRPLLELLQNIEDDLKESETDNCQALFLFKESTLWIANRGGLFTDRGFQSLCDSNDSPKHGKGYIGSKGTGFKAVLNWTEEPAIYSGRRSGPCRFGAGKQHSISSLSCSATGYLHETQLQRAHRTRRGQGIADLTQRLYTRRSGYFNQEH